MAADTYYKLPGKFLLLIAFLFYSAAAFSQRQKADSISRELSKEKTDTGKVRQMWTLADVIYRFSPDSAFRLAQEALNLSRQINDKEGESRSLGVLANTFMRIGNYPRALELNIQKLKLEEKRNKPRNLASVTMNIGIVYVYQEEYRKALEYYSKADSIISKYDNDDFKELKYSILLNLGDVYNRLNISDSAYVYFNKSLERAKKINDINRVGISMTGLGHSFRKLGSFQQSQTNYQNGLAYLRAANDDVTFCEAALGLANLYKSINKVDSADYYAMLSLSVAKKDKFLSQQLEAAEFLTDQYKRSKNVDSAFAYINYMQELNDSVNSKSRIRQLQIISSDEQFRQRELEEKKRMAQKKRIEQLQYMLIAIFIPALFLITLLLSRVRVHTKLIRLLGVLSLLFLFEYLTLLLHPTITGFTNHSPILEILIFVVLAAILIPAHHRLEHWLIHKLSHYRIHHADKKTELTQSPSHTGNKKSPN